MQRMEKKKKTNFFPTIYCEHIVCERMRRKCSTDISFETETLKTYGRQNLRTHKYECNIKKKRQSKFTIYCERLTVEYRL